MHSSNMKKGTSHPRKSQGFKVLADKLVEWRKDDPSLKVAMQKQNSTRRAFSECRKEQRKYC